MATVSLFLLFSTLVIFISPSIAQTLHTKPKALVLPVTKDSATGQYVTLLHQRTPLVPVKLTIDLSGKYLWVNCEESYVSSTYKPAHCHTPQCSITGIKYCADCFLSKPGCNINTCSLFPNNILTRTNEVGEVAQDLVSVHSTDGSNPGKMISVPSFLFTCGRLDLLEGLAKGVKGMAGLGRSKISVPTLFASAFNFPTKFAICLSSSTSSRGVMFLGDGPYVLLPGIDISKSLIFTPLIKNPDTSAGPIFHASLSAEYFIGLKSIRINGKSIPLNSSLLSIGDEGEGGTKISTLNPYTVMETSIYNAFVSAFAKELENVSKAEAIKPFKLCFKGKSLGRRMPTIELVLERNVVWRIYGANSMIQVRREASCLAFLDGGLEPTTSIVIGGHQLEDNLLQFDLVNARLGFSNSLVLKQTTCSNFNFTSTTYSKDEF